MANLACKLDIEVIVEGVGTKEQSTLLEACGCGIAQGYLYGRPMPVAKPLKLIDGE